MPPRGVRYEYKDWIESECNGRATERARELADEFSDRAQEIVAPFLRAQFGPNFESHARYEADALAWKSYASVVGHGVGLWEEDGDTGLPGELEGKLDVIVKKDRKLRELANEIQVECAGTEEEESGAEEQRSEPINVHGLTSPNDPNAFPLGKYAIAPPGTPQWLITFPAEPPVMLAKRTDESGRSFMRRWGEQVGQEYEEVPLQVPWPGAAYVEIDAPYTSDVMFTRRSKTRKGAKWLRHDFPLWEEPIDHEHTMVLLAGGLPLLQFRAIRRRRPSRSKKKYRRRRPHHMRPHYDVFRPDNPEYASRLYKRMSEDQKVIRVLHRGSPVWWVDLDDGPQEAATLRDLVLQKQPVTTKKGKKLWLMSLDQWDRAEYPPESEGGPPYVQGVSVAREVEEKYTDPTYFHEVWAPPGTPEWLVSERYSGTARKRVKPMALVRVQIPTEYDRFFDREGLYADWEHFYRQLLTHPRRVGAGPRTQDPIVKEMYASAKALRRKKEKRPDFLEPGDDTVVTGLGAISVFHGDSPVWWVDLDSGPVATVTLFDLAAIEQPAAFREGVVMPPLAREAGTLWMMSLDQWDNAEWPPESEGGPPYTPHVSVAHEAKKRAAKKEISIDDEEDVLTEMSKAIDVKKDDLLIFSGRRYGSYSGDATTWQVNVGEDGAEYFVVADYDAAEQLAIAEVEDRLRDDASSFNQDFIERHIDVDNLRNQLRSDAEEYNRDYLKDIGAGQFWRNAEGYENHIYVPEEDEDGERREPTEEEIELLVELMTEADLQNPIEYLNNQLDEEQAMRRAIELGGINIEEAAKEAVRDDGPGFWLASYDNELRETPGGFIYWRTN